MVLGRLLFGAALTLAVSMPPADAGAKTFKILYSFEGGSDGRMPTFGPLAADPAGNLYGTTLYGGASNLGTVFKLAPDGTETVLHSFTSGRDGSSPIAGLVADKAGNFYGVTWYGGAANLGAVYEIAPDGTKTEVYSFKGGADGMWPNAKLAIDANGNLFGTTSYGGGSTKCENGCGTVFRIGPDGRETVIHAFANGSDGAFPTAEVIFDKAGNLYSTTVSGGIYAGRNRGSGTVFKIAADGTETILHVFRNRKEGYAPQGALLADADGNLYGTTSQADPILPNKCPYRVGCGSLFKLAPDGTFTVLHLFRGGSDGSRPRGRLMFDAAGNLIGTTSAGGSKQCGYGCGTVFRLAPDGSLAILHAFKAKEGPAGDLFAASDGTFYGISSSSDPSHDGTVFRLREN
jgi:uncharacterized repeat protein (TIGR03803 family)